MTIRKPLTITNGQIEAFQSGDLVSGVANVLTNTTLYVETTGNDTTGDGSIGNPWLTIGKALSYLADKWIEKDNFVTINVGDGNFAISSSLTIKHPCGDRITITGTNTHDKTLSSIQSSSGSAGAWSYVLNVNTVTNIAVNDYVLIRGPANGTRPEFIAGCHEVTNVDAVNTRITIAVKHKHTSVASGSVTGTVTCVKTRVTVTGVDGLVVDPNHTLGFMDKVVFVGDATATKSGILSGHGLAAANTHLWVGNNVGVVNFQYGVQVVGGSFRGNIIASGCVSDGARTFAGAKIYASSGITATGCGAFGVFATLNGSIYCPASRLTGNSDSGAGASAGGVVSCPSAHLTGNTLNGAVAENQGCILCDLAFINNNLDNGIIALNQSHISSPSATIQTNFKGVYCDKGSYIYVEGSTISSNTSGSYNISADTLSVNGSYIDTGAAAGFPIHGSPVPGGRLTLESNVAVSTTDQASASTIYYKSFQHGHIWLYNGSEWLRRTLPGGQISAACPTASGSNKPYDVFIYDDNGTPTLEFLAWTNNTTRATGLLNTSSPYLWTKSGDTTRLYVGTIYVTTSGNTNDTLRSRHVWNMFNRVVRDMFWIGPQASYTYSANNVARYVNGGTAPSLSIVVGLSEDIYQAEARVTASKSVGANGTAIDMGIARDATNTTFAVGCQAGVIRSTTATDLDLRTLQTTFSEIAPIGYHEYNWTERTGTNSVTLNVVGTNANECGMFGWFPM